MNVKKGKTVGNGLAEVDFLAGDMLIEGMLADDRTNAAKMLSEALNKRPTENTANDNTPKEGG